MADLVRLYQGRLLWFWCPGCEEPHVYEVGPGDRWQWNGSLTSPTVTPSYLTWRTGNPDATEEYAKYRTNSRCHLFMTDGKLQFLGDCTHALAGQTVPLLPDRLTTYIEGGE